MHNSTTHWDAAIIGGGAAGFFSSVIIAENFPGARIGIFEKGGAVLQKVKVSGGGRCNVTNGCADPRALTTFYPRGAKELLGPFTRFNTVHTREWFTAHGVPLTVEPDDRVFPASNSSESIMQCLVTSAAERGVHVHLHAGLNNFTAPDDKSDRYSVALSNGSGITCDSIIIATGSSLSVWDVLSDNGIAIVPPVASLFSFAIDDLRIPELAGLSVQSAKVQIAGTKFEQIGPLLITHNGFSGPAILTLSSRAARHLAGSGYRAKLIINWTGDITAQALAEELKALKRSIPQKQIGSFSLYGLPSRLWKYVLSLCGLAPQQSMQSIPDKALMHLAHNIASSEYTISGKNTNKDEFVTCGGVKLTEVNFKTMEHKKFTGLYFAGEVLDIDGLTGGFNFQAAWTTAYIAAMAITEKLHSAKDMY